MYSFDPYDNVYTCRLPAGMPSAAAPVDEALDRGLPHWIGIRVPHAPERPDLIRVLMRVSCVMTPLRVCTSIIVDT